MDIQPTDEAVLAFVEAWISLLSEGRYGEAYHALAQPLDDVWSPDLIEEITRAYELPPAAGDDSGASHVTSTQTARVVDYSPDKDVSWFEGNPDSNAGMVHYSLPINSVWSDLTAVFRIHRHQNRVRLELEDIHVL
jgi:hypothetical protein